MWLFHRMYIMDKVVDKVVIITKDSLEQQVDSQMAFYGIDKLSDPDGSIRKGIKYWIAKKLPNFCASNIDICQRQNQVNEFSRQKTYSPNAQRLHVNASIQRDEMKENGVHENARFLSEIADTIYPPKAN